MKTNFVTKIAAQVMPFARRYRLRRALLLGIISSLLIVTIGLLRLFTDLRMSLYNIYYVPDDTSNTIAIVALDDRSLEAYGRAPTTWDRRLYADLIAKLSQAGARVLAFDILFDQPTDSDPLLVAAMQEARNSESRLRFVMPLVGEDVLTPQANSPMLRFDNLLKPQAPFLEAADYQGFVNVKADVDKEIRRQPTFVEAAGERGLSFSLATFMAYLRIPSAATDQVITSKDGLLTIAGQHSITIDENGLWYLTYFGAPAQKDKMTFPIYSFKDVLDGKIDATAFHDKVVLLGLVQNIGQQELFSVPIQSDGQLMSGIEIHANAIESIIQNKTLRMQPRVWQVIVVVFMSVLSAVVYQQLRWYWTPLLFLIGVVIWVTASTFHFLSTREMPNPLASLLSMLIPGLLTIGVQLNAEIQQREKTEFLLQSVVEASQQHLALDKILAALGADVRRLLNAERVQVYLRNGSGLRVAYRSDSADVQTTQEITPLIYRVKESNKSGIEQGWVAAPMRWQGKTVGVISAQNNSTPSEDKLSILARLAEQIAPSVENALLHAETDLQKSRLEALLQNSPVGIVLLNRRLNITDYNFAALAALQQEQDSVRGQSLLLVLRKVGVDDGVLNHLRVGFSTNSAFRQDLKIIDQSYVMQSAFLPEMGEWLLLFSDVTALTLLNDLRSRMVRLASHDLKNPLMGVQGYANLMLEGIGGSVFTAKDHEYLQEILNSAGHMLQIIEEVLNLERSRASRTEFSPVAIADVVEEVVLLHRREAENRGQTISVEVQESLPQVLGDERQLIQSFGNFMTNGIKYTPDNGHLWVRAYRRNQYIRFEVQDTGYGIPEDQHNKIFLEFSRVRTKETKHIPGTGLGLSLVKSIIEMHGGRVGFISKEGEGSLFFAELPILVSEGNP